MFDALPGAERDRPLVTACCPAAARLPVSRYLLIIRWLLGDWRREEVEGCLTPFRVVNGIF